MVSHKIAVIAGDGIRKEVMPEGFRVLKFAFDLAQSRSKKHQTGATKSNGIAITMPYWDERVAEMAQHCRSLLAKAWLTR